MDSDGDLMADAVCESDKKSLALKVAVVIVNSLVNKQVRTSNK